MAIELLRQSRLGSNRAESVYLLTDQASDIAARSLLLTTAAATYNGLQRRDSECVVEEDEGGDGSDQTYLGRVIYGAGGGSQTADLELGDTRILISSAGGSVHITHSLDTPHSYGDAEDHQQAIGVDAEGNIAGTDILTGGLDITIVKIIASSALTTAYLSNLLSLCTPNPHTNAATFAHTDSDGRAFSLAIGEALFVGFSNQARGAGQDELRLEFKGSKNLADALPSSPWTITKDGWEHLWQGSERDVDPTANKMVSVASSAYVEQVYPSGNFGLLL